MSKIVMYYHAGAGNHGCEAIIRATQKILNKDMTLYSVCPEEDIQYGLNQIVEVKEDHGKVLSKPSLEYYRAAVSHKVRKDDFEYISLSHKAFFNQAQKGDIYLSIGGDNYCYAGRDILGYYNERLHQKGAKTVLWGCSFEPSDMTEKIAEDLARYDLIVAREQISFDALKKVNKNTVLFPDPAFQLDTEFLPLPEGFEVGHTIGMNVSPLAAGCAAGTILLDNYRALIHWIIDHTKEKIALIPHVVKSGNDDREPLKKLYSEFVHTGRVLMIEDCNCMQLKGYIARCRLFVGARTHATIAAYSSCVPTLVLGYSVKSRGIARELFGTDNNYVLPVQELSDENTLTDAMKWLMAHEVEIRTHLEEIIPDYIGKANLATDELLKLS